MEKIFMYIVYVFVSFIFLGLILVIIYGLIELINNFIDDYRDGMYWFSPKK